MVCGRSAPTHQTLVLEDGRHHQIDFGAPLILAAVVKIQAPNVKHKRGPWAILGRYRA